MAWRSSWDRPSSALSWRSWRSNARRVVPADALIDAVWGETPPRTAAHSIQIYVSELRKALAAVPAVRIATARPGYRFDAPAGWVDVVEFERIVAVGMETDDLAALESAMALWSAEPLDEFRHEAWARPHIERLMDRRANGRVASGGGHARRRP